MTTKSTSNERKKKKKDEFEIVRIKNFCAKEVKTIHRRTLHKSYISGKKLVSRVCKELSQLYYKKTNN